MTYSSFFPVFEQLFILAYGAVFLHMGIQFRVTKDFGELLKSASWFLIIFGMLCLTGSASLYLRLENGPVNFLVFLSLTGLGPRIPDLIHKALGQNSGDRLYRKAIRMLFFTLAVSGCIAFALLLPVRYIYAAGYIWLDGLILGELYKSYKLYGKWALLPGKLRIFFSLVIGDAIMVTGMLVVQLSGQVQWMLPFWVILIFSLVILSILIAKYPDFLTDLKEEAENIERLKSGISPEMEAETLRRIKKYMEIDKLYLSPELRINDLAGKLQLSVPAVSEIINRHFDQNFNKWINSYRLEYAAELLINHREIPILEVILESGFNSKSVFNTAFKAKKGMTPSAYRKNHKKDPSL